MTSARVENASAVYIDQEGDYAAAVPSALKSLAINIGATALIEDLSRLTKES